jgi:cytochrome P450
MCSFSLDQPLYDLDPLTPAHVEGEQLARYGPLVPVNVYGGVRAWAATDVRTARTVFEDHPQLSKNPEHWGAYTRGEVPPDWPLLSLVIAESMLNTDGIEHHRLRRLVTFAFTPKRVRALAPRITEITKGLLADVATKAADGPVDLKETFAFPLPMKVICELFGITEPGQVLRLREHYTTMLSVEATGRQRQDAAVGLKELLRQLVDDRRATPADDLTSDLAAIRDKDDRLTMTELVDTLEIILLAGHETMVNALTNTVHALLTHPRQLTEALAGNHSWTSVLEAGLRWDGPLRSVYMRYATQDTVIGGVTVRRGEPILVALATANRDSAAFNLNAPPSPHLAFGAGPHFCLGATLARLEGEIALRELFSRFPGLRMAVPEVTTLISPAINGLAALPVLVG